MVSSAKTLKSELGDTVKFLGRVSFEDLKKHFASCQALVFPGEEDFGMIPVEVMAAGRPVIAYGRGGALDTVVPGVSGHLFTDQSVDGLIQAVSDFEAMSFNPHELRVHAKSYGIDPFRQKDLSLAYERMELMSPANPHVKASEDLVSQAIEAASI